MPQCWAVCAPSEQDEMSMSDILSMPDKAFHESLGSLYAFGGGKSPPSTFGAALKNYMNCSGVNVEELSFQSGITERTIGAMRNKPGYRPNTGNVVAICIALGLRASYSYRLIELAGIRLQDDSKQDIAYRFLLDRANRITIEQANEFLLRAGLKPL